MMAHGRISWLILGVVLALLTSLGLAADVGRPAHPAPQALPRSASENYTLIQGVVSGGGSGAVAFQSAGYRSTGTLGQPSDTPALASTGFRHFPGFWGPCVAVSGAGFTLAPAAPQPGETVAFTATVAGGEAPLTYAWSLGDGVTATGPAVTHGYAAAGRYTVTLTVQNCGGAGISSAQRTVNVAGTEWNVYVPLLQRGYYFNPHEPNDSPTQAWGPLQPAQAYASLPDDADDWFYVELGTAGDLRAVVTGYSAQGNLLLYAEGNYTEPIAQWGQGGGTMVAGPVAVAAGRYYVRVYTAGGFNTDELYNLVVTYP